MKQADGPWNAFLALVFCFGACQGSEEPIKSEGDEFPPAYTSTGIYNRQNPYPNDLGQRADIIITVNGSSQPQHFVNGSQPFTGAIAARAVNFPYREIRILSTEASPQLPSIQIRSATTESTFLWQPQPGQPNVTLTVRVRDMAACQSNFPNSPSRCQNARVTISNADYQQSFQFFSTPPQKSRGDSKIGTALLGAGIGALAAIIFSRGLDEAYGGTLNGCIYSLPRGSFGGGIPFNLGYGVNPWPQSNGTFGSYPGYGYSGLGNSNPYGGYFNNSGYGYGDTRYMNPNRTGSWANGFYNYYDNNSYYYDRSNPLGSSFANSTNRSFCNQNPYQCQQSYNGIYGNSGYYNGWGRAPTFGRNYNYFNYETGTGYGLADTSDLGEPEGWLVH